MYLCLVPVKAVPVIDASKPLTLLNLDFSVSNLRVLNLSALNGVCDLA